MSKRRKTSMNQLVKEVSGELSSYDVINQALGQHLDGLSPQEALRIQKALKKKGCRGADIGYIKAILFPEYFSQDIPQPLTNVSYSRFTDKQEANIETGISGSGMLLWYPRTICGPSLFFLPGNIIPPLKVLSGNADTVAHWLDTWSGLGTAWRVGFSQQYDTTFHQLALVAGSLQLQFVGQQEKESGLLVGSQVYGASPGTMTLDDVENGQFVTRARPSEGLRFVYLPMEGTDYEFYPATPGVAHNQGAQPTGGEQMFKVNVSSTSTTMKLDGVTPFPTPLMVDQGVTKTEIAYSANTNCVAIYWSGLPTPTVQSGITEKWLRVDATRKFNAIPRAEFRDIMEVTRSKKAYDSKKTFDCLRELCLNTPVGGHTLREASKQMDRIVDAVPNISTLMQGRGFDDIGTLDDLAVRLEQPMAQSKGLIGSSGGVPMIYNTALGMF